MSQPSTPEINEADITYSEKEFDHGAKFDVLATYGSGDAMVRAPSFTDLVEYLPNGRIKSLPPERVAARKELARAAARHGILMQLAQKAGGSA